MNFTIHAGFFVMLLADLLLARSPVPFGFLWLLWVVGSLYVVWNVVYWALTGVTIYSILDWTLWPGTSAGIAVGVVLVATPLVLAIVWSCAFCREWRHLPKDAPATNALGVLGARSSFTCTATPVLAVVLVILALWGMGAEGCLGWDMLRVHLRTRVCKRWSILFWMGAASMRQVRLNDIPTNARSRA